MVVLGLEADDSCEEKCKSCDKRAVKLGLEWNNNFEMSWNFVGTLIVNLENFRVLDDFGLDWTGQNLDLWDRARAVLMSAVMSFALFSFLSA